MLAVLVILCTILSLLSFFAGIRSLRRRGFVGGTIGLLMGLLFLSLAGLLGMIAVAVQGYRAWSHEEVAAAVKIDPAGPQKFTAQIRLANGRLANFSLAGDEIYVDAHILKWKPIANFFGLRTAYELDRVAGRYSRLEDERTKPRTIFRVSQGKFLDMFTLRQRYSFLEPLLDAEYGSATFVAADQAVELEIRVSTTGLLIRKIERKAQ